MLKIPLARPEASCVNCRLVTAGTAARADDASTVYANPAGMTRLAGDQFTVAGQALYGDAKFKQDGQGLLTGSNPGNALSGGYDHPDMVFMAVNYSHRF